MNTQDFYDTLPYQKKEIIIDSSFLIIGITKNDRGEFPIYTYYTHALTENPKDLHSILVEESDALRFDEILVIENNQVRHHYMEGRDF